MFVFCGLDLLFELVWVLVVCLLVSILKVVVSWNVDLYGGDILDDWNFFMCLVGNYDRGFVYSVFEFFVD